MCVCVTGSRHRFQSRQSPWQLPQKAIRFSRAIPLEWALNAWRHTFLAKNFAKLPICEDPCERIGRWRQRNVSHCAVPTALRATSVISCHACGLALQLELRACGHGRWCWPWSCRVCSCKAIPAATVAVGQTWMVGGAGNVVVCVLYCSARSRCSRSGDHG